MIRRTLLGFLSIVALVSCGLVSCGRAGVAGSGPRYTNAPYSDPCLKPTLETPAQVSVGAGLEALLKLTNTCNAFQTAYLVDPVPANLLIGQNGTVMWSLHERGGTRPSLPPIPKTLKPEEAAEFTLVWTGENANGDPLPVGTYEAVGLLTVVSSDPSRPYRDFEVIAPVTVTPAP